MNRSSRLLKFLSSKFGVFGLLAAVSLYSLPAQATFELGMDVFFSVLSGFSDEIHLRTRTRFYVELGDFAAGAVARVEPQHEYLTDTTYGLGVRYGTEFFVEGDAGMLRRSFDGALGTGQVFSLLFGWNLSEAFRLVIPFTAKHVSFENDERWIVDYVPFFGARVVF